MKKALAIFIASVLAVSAAIVGASAGSNVDPWIGSWSAAYNADTTTGEKVPVEKTIVIAESGIRDGYPYLVRQETSTLNYGKTRVTYEEFLAVLHDYATAPDELELHPYDGVTLDETTYRWNLLTASGADSLTDNHGVTFTRSGAGIRYGKTIIPGHWQFVNKTFSDLQAMIDYNAPNVCSLTERDNVFKTTYTDAHYRKTVQAEHFCEAPPEILRIGESITLKASVDVTGSDTPYGSHVVGVAIVSETMGTCNISATPYVRHGIGESGWTAVANGQFLQNATRCETDIVIEFPDTNSDRLNLTIRVYNGELFSYDIGYNYIWVDGNSMPGGGIVPEQPEATNLPVETVKPEETAEPVATAVPEPEPTPKAKEPDSGRTPETGKTSAIVDIAAGEYFTLGLRQDGTVVAAGDNSKGQCDIEGWNGIEAIAAGLSHSVGLTRDGEVVATGDNELGQCDVEGWEDIVEISAGYGHTVGLKGDGTVVATGFNGDGQLNVKKWRNIIAVAAGGWHTVGLKADGTVVATGYNQYGQCNVKKWSGIVALSAGGWHSLGVQKNGRVIAAGYAEDGQCDVGAWRSVTAISASGYHTAGLKKAKTAVAEGRNDFGQCDVYGWAEIIDVAAGGYHTVALLKDGSVVAIGNDDYGQCEGADWGAGSAKSYDGTGTASDESGDTGSAGE